jgi:hypothetical protein
MDTVLRSVSIAHCVTGVRCHSAGHSQAGPGEARSRDRPGGGARVTLSSEKPTEGILRNAPGGRIFAVFPE